VVVVDVDVEGMDAGMAGEDDAAAEAAADEAMDDS